MTKPCSVCDDPNAEVFDEHFYGEPTSYGELARQYGLSVSSVSQHLHNPECLLYAFFRFTRTWRTEYRKLQQRLKREDRLFELGAAYMSNPLWPGWRKRTLRADEIEVVCNESVGGPRDETEMEETRRVLLNALLRRCKRLGIELEDPRGPHGSGKNPRSGS